MLQAKLPLENYPGNGIYNTVCKPIYFNANIIFAPIHLLQIYKKQPIFKGKVAVGFELPETTYQIVFKPDAIEI